MMAVDDDVRLGIEFLLRPVGKFFQRYRMASGNGRCLRFPGLAHIHQAQWLSGLAGGTLLEAVKIVNGNFMFHT